MVMSCVFQLGNQQQQEYRVIRNEAGNTATQMKIHRSATHNSKPQYVQLTIICLR
jgi:hypothetical protein